MKDRRKLIIVLFLAVVAFLLLWWLFLAGGRKPYSWREHYKASSQDPYGTYLFYELMKDYVGEDAVHKVTDSLHLHLDTLANSGSYLFIGEALYMDSTDLAGLLHFVAAGNTAFLSSKTVPYDLMFHLYYYECDGILWNDYDVLTSPNIKARMNDFQPVSFFYQRRQDTLPYPWSYIAEDYFCESYNQFIALGRMNDEYVNLAEVPYYKGKFYLHTTPLAFTNISLLDSNRLAYAEGLFSFLPFGEIYWDAYTKVPEAVGRNMNNNYPPANQRISAESPLQYVLSQPPLAWAWYVLLVLGLLYLVFRTRRRQRIIPVAAPNTNTSLEFIRAIGRLYFLQQNHKQLCKQKTRLFLAFLRNRYGLQWRGLEEDQLNELSNLSGISEPQLEKLAITSKNLQNAYFVSENSLIDYHQQLDLFYRNCN